MTAAKYTHFRHISVRIQESGNSKHENNKGKQVLASNPHACIKVALAREKKAHINNLFTARELHINRLHNQKTINQLKGLRIKTIRDFKNTIAR